MCRWTTGLVFGAATVGWGVGLPGDRAASAGRGPLLFPPPPADAADTVIRSPRWPPAGVVVDPSFRYLGSRTIDLGGAEAEIHVLVDTGDDGGLDRFYWIQFEGRKSGRPGRYDYSGLAGRDTIDGYSFYTDVRRGAYTEAEVQDEPDTGTVGAILAEHGFDFPDPMMRTRMVTLDAERRAELLVIYMEALDWNGLSLDALESDEDAWARAAAALRERAADGLALVPAHSESPEGTEVESPGGWWVARVPRSPDSSDVSDPGSRAGS